MPRNRMIKPEFFESDTLMKISLEAQLTFIGMWCHCDDYGCCLSSPRRILGQVYPLRDDVTEKKLQEWLIELVDNKLIIPIDYKGKSLFIVRSWFEHQTVQHPSKRRYIKEADFQQVITDSIESHEDILRDYVESHAPKRKKKAKEKEEKEKTAYADHVRMTEDQYNKLVSDIGLDGAKACIDKLNLYKASNGKQYKCDYSAIGAWVLAWYDENKRSVAQRDAECGNATNHEDIDRSSQEFKDALARLNKGVER